MKELEPNYNCPCSQTIIRRLRILEDEVKIKIQRMLVGVQYVSIDTDCWTSRSQEGYISVNAHIIGDKWIPHSFNVCTEELEERHTAENLADILYNVMVQFEIHEKIVAIANDNASNILKAVQMMPNVPNDITCAAQKIHLAVQHALQEREVSHILNKATKIVSHFRHSAIASKSLEQKQEQLDLPKLKLI
ncbi:Zinc finger BED domain-containing protein [Ooceraea biroi]|uniref:Zinc finger BED domain-containing protein n=1 Tax=Ooceraea biroi TaxID=2015173 RepID=A0A026WS25_OOCBI|nr:Zinc finger BED domain-containing protein [Ooceraea biroi]